MGANDTERPDWVIMDLEMPLTDGLEATRHIVGSHPSARVLVLTLHFQMRRWNGYPASAPWHDDLDCYRRLAARMRANTRIFQSLHLWDICALLAHSRGYCGSSLHGGIVAGAFALPHLYLLHPYQAGRTTKQAAYAETWKAPCPPLPVTVENMAEGTHQAPAVEPGQLEASATALAARYRQAFEDMRRCL